MRIHPLCAEDDGFCRPADAIHIYLALVTRSLRALLLLAYGSHEHAYFITQHGVSIADEQERCKHRISQDVLGNTMYSSLSIPVPDIPKNSAQGSHNCSHQHRYRQCEQHG